MIVSLAALVLAVALAGAGWAAAMPLAELTTSALGLTELVITSPAEVPAFQLWHAVAFGFAGVLAWVPCLVLRIRLGKDPAPAWLATLYLASLLALPAGMALRFAFLASLSDPSPAGIEPMVALSSLSLLGWGVRLSIFASVMLCLLALSRKRGVA